jgi:hypothetical protein
MRFAGIIGAVGLAALLGGCAVHSSEAVKTLPSDMIKQARIYTITVKSVPDNVSSGFKPELESMLRLGMDDCAQGQSWLNLEVTVIQLKKSDAGKAFLVGDSNVVKGQARLVDPTSGAVVGDYDIGYSVGGGGLAAALAMSQAESSMARGFAKQVCDTAFPGHPRFRRLG